MRKSLRKTTGKSAQDDRTTAIGGTSKEQDYEQGKEVELFGQKPIVASRIIDALSFDRACKNWETIFSSFGTNTIHLYCSIGKP